MDATREIHQAGSAGERELEDRFGTRARAETFRRTQVLDHLNERMREFVGLQELLFVATADGRGDCDCSFRAGPPGFVRVLDERRLAYPEYRGNGVLASLGNISENPRVGLFFVDFVRDVIGLHVNGSARIVEADGEAEFGLARADPDGPPGRRPERWVLIEVQEAYIHCSKHLPRMTPVSRQIHWGTDDVKHKGGDFFGATRPPGSTGRVNR